MEYITPCDYYNQQSEKHVEKEHQLRFAVKEYLEYWNHYRPHAGLDGRMVLPYPQDADGEIQEISFLVVCFMATAA